MLSEKRGLTSEQEFSTLERSLRHELQQMTECIESLTQRVGKFEEKLTSSESAARRQLNDKEKPFSPNPVMHHSSGTDGRCKNLLPEASPQQQLSQLQSQIHSLKVQQMSMEREKEKEKRICNVLLGNVEVGESESITETKEKVATILKEKLQIDVVPMHSTRLGKPTANKSRLILVKLKCPEDRLIVLKLAKMLRGSGLFVMEDLRKEEREERNSLVSVMKRARNEGKRAFIRYSDGKLIIKGEIYVVPAKVRMSSVTSSCLLHD